MNPAKIAQALQRAQSLLRANDVAGAVKVLEQTVRQHPKSLEAWFLLGQIHGSQGRHGEAKNAFGRAVAINSRVPEAHFNLGLALKSLGNLPAAAEAFGKATALKTGYVAAWYNLGSTLLDLDRFDEAEQAFLQVLKHDASDQIYLALGIAAQGGRRYAEAIEYYRQALRCGNDSFTLHLNLGTAYYSHHDFENGLRHSLAAHRLNPDEPIAIHNIADCYLEMGEIDKALEYYKMSRYPVDETAYLYALNFLEHYDAERIFREHKAWGDKAIDAAPRAPLPQRDTSPDRRLRIGYLSADFRQHAVSTFFEQILKNHDHSQFEIFCYADVRLPDQVTARLQGHADHWRDITRLGDDRLADLLRADGIDILVDLGGHTSERSRLLARRNAPIQVNYLGHVSTTGLSTVDYRFTDALVDPPGDADRHHTETLVRLGNNFFTYTPPEQAPDIGPLPMLANGCVTFASFNRLYKLNPRTIGLWSQAMAALPGSRMLIVGRAVSTEHGKARVIKLFESFGISADRLEFIAFLPLNEYLAIHNRVDLVMDCFPWNGHTTTMQSLWMGVPTITIEGRHHAGRFGYAIMTNLGLPECIADNENSFVDRVTAIASQPQRLADLRQGMRQRVAQSVLCDHLRLTKDIEENYRKMWECWLTRQRS